MRQWGKPIYAFNPYFFVESVSVGIHMGNFQRKPNPTSALERAILKGGHIKYLGKLLSITASLILLFSFLCGRIGTEVPSAYGAPKLTILTQARLIHRKLYHAIDDDTIWIEGQLVGDQGELISRAVVTVRCRSKNRPRRARSRMLKSQAVSSFSGELRVIIPPACHPSEPSLLWKTQGEMSFDVHMAPTELSSGFSQELSFQATPQWVKLTLDPIKGEWSSGRPHLLITPKGMIRRELKPHIKGQIDVFSCDPQTTIRYQRDLSLSGEAIHIPLLSWGCWIVELKHVGLSWARFTASTRRAWVYPKVQLLLNPLSPLYYGPITAQGKVTVERTDSAWRALQKTNWDIQVQER